MKVFSVGFPQNSYICYACSFNLERDVIYFTAIFKPG